MKIVDASAYSKDELKDMVNYLINTKYEFAKSRYMLDFQFKKKMDLLDQARSLVESVKHLPYTQRGFLERKKILKKIDTIHKQVDKIEKSMVID